MSKNLTMKDLVLYLGSWAQSEGVYHTSKKDIGVITSLHEGKVQLEDQNDKWIEFVEKVRPILRPLPDMTAGEALNYAKITEAYSARAAEYCRDQWGNPAIKCRTVNHIDFKKLLLNNPHEFRFLLDHHFDLFGWIDAGLAIDATTLNPNPYKDYHNNET